MSETQVMVRLDGRPACPGVLTVQASGLYSWSVRVPIALVPGTEEWVTMDARLDVLVGKGLVSEMSWPGGGSPVSLILGDGPLAAMERLP